MNAPALSAAVRPAPMLTSDVFARLETATRTLLSPLSLSSADDWRQEVMKAVSSVFGADQASFNVPGERNVISVWGVDEAVTAPMALFTGSVYEGRGGSPEPLLDMWFERLVAQNLRVWDMHSADHLLGGGGVAWNNLFHNEVLAPNHMSDTNSLFMPMRGGGAHLAVHRLRRPHEPGEHLPLLRVLLPAFESGLAALDRFAAHRAALDAISEPVAVFDADGVEIHRNPAFTRLLARDPEASRVETALSRLVFRMRPLAFALRGERMDLGTPAGNVQTSHTRYTLRGTVLGPGAYGADGALLVSLDTEKQQAELPSAEALRARFELTRREAETAVLVAQGLSNDEIADRLFVSRHTVRHHVESLMSKLDLTGRGRAMVAARLLNPEATA